VLGLIAGFAAGSNDYEGVSAMCATSRLMNVEVTPVLYETLFWNNSLHTQLQKSLGKLSNPKFRYARYVPPEIYIAD
jgi:hypothetical protein